MAAPVKYSELPPHIAECLDSVLQKENLAQRDLKCEIKIVSKGMWVSSLYLVKASDSDKTVSLYMKTLPIGATPTAVSRSHLHFCNEVVFYNTVIPAFEQLKREKGFQDLKLPLCVPKCYLAQENGENDIIIMKDMSTSGYITLDPLKPMGIPETIIAFKELGKLHGYSLALKFFQPQKLKEIRDKLIEPVYANPQYEEAYLAMGCYHLKSVHAVMKNHYEEGSLYLEKFRIFITKTSELFPILTRTDPSNEPHNVITHGDVWMSNFLFHYNEQGNKADGVCMLDFQQIRYNSPAIDLGRLLYVSLDKAARDQHKNSVLKSYYNSLSETLREFGLDSDYIFPFCKLESQLKKYSTFFIYNATFNLVHALDEQEREGCAIDETDEMTKSISDVYHRMTDECRRRIFEIIEESVDLHYMDF